MIGSDECSLTGMINPSGAEQTVKSNVVISLECLQSSTVRVDVLDLDVGSACRQTFTHIQTVDTVEDLRPAAGLQDQRIPTNILYFSFFLTPYSLPRLNFENCWCKCK